MKRLCLCGSGLPRRELIDARNIFLTFVCDACEEAKRKVFKPEVLTNPNYPTEEPIEED